MREPKTISDPHLIAELAAAHGEVSLLADYFRVQQNPSPEVVKAISRHLDGSDNWKLTFTTRTGGRPPAWAIGQERTLSSQLFNLAGKLPGLPLSEIERRFLLKLAEAFDPEGKGKFKLVYKCRRRGNPATPLRRQIKTAILGLTANKLYLQLENWTAVDEKLQEMGLTGIDNSARKKAVQFVNRAKK